MGTSDGDREFGEVLAELKARGCTALVTGHAPDGTFDEISANFLGGRPERRARVFGLLDRDVETARARLAAAGPGYEPAIVVDAGGDEPRAAAATRPHLGDRTLAVRRADRSLAAVESELVDAVHDARQLHGPFEPGELRVCVDSLRPLVAEQPTAAVRDVLASVADAVVAADAMGHFVLPGDRTDPAVESLATAADVLVEFREQDGRVEYRWSFRDYDAATSWIRF